MEAMTVWKFPIALPHITLVNVVEMPAGAEILCAREQGDSFCIWARVDPGANVEPVEIAIVGTGHPAPDDGKYIGTALFFNGSLVLHAFVAPTRRDKP